MAGKRPRPEVDPSTIPPDLGHGWEWTDMLDQGNIETALKMLKAQEGITAIQADELREMFEHPASALNVTRHRIVYERKGKPGRPSRSEILARLDLDNLKSPVELRKLVLLVEGCAGHSNPYPIRFKLISRREGRKAAGHEERARLFTARLAADSKYKQARGKPSLLKQQLFEMAQKTGQKRTTLIKRYRSRKPAWLV